MHSQLWSIAVLDAARAASLLLSLAPVAVAGQRAPSAAAAVSLSAHVPPRITPLSVSEPAVQTTDGQAVITRHIVVSANVEYTLRVRLAENAAGRQVQVLASTGEWRPVPAQGAVPLYRSASFGAAGWTLQCRVARRASVSPPDDCPLSYELVSRDPRFSMLVIVPMAGAEASP